MQFEDPEWCPNCVSLMNFSSRFMVLACIVYPFREGEAVVPEIASMTAIGSVQQQENQYVGQTPWRRPAHVRATAVRTAPDHQPPSTLESLDCGLPACSHQCHEPPRGRGIEARASFDAIHLENSRTPNSNCTTTAAIFLLAGTETASNAPLLRIVSGIPTLSYCNCSARSSFGRTGRSAWRGSRWRGFKNKAKCLLLGRSRRTPCWAGGGRDRLGDRWVGSNEAVEARGRRAIGRETVLAVTRIASPLGKQTLLGAAGSRVFPSCKSASCG